MEHDGMPTKVEQVHMWTLNVDDVLVRPGLLKVNWQTGGGGEGGEG